MRAAARSLPQLLRHSLRLASRRRPFLSGLTDRAASSPSRRRQSTDWGQEPVGRSPRWSISISGCPQ